MDVKFSSSRLLPSTSIPQYAAQDFEALLAGVAPGFAYSVQSGDPILLFDFITDTIQNDYGYDDFENLNLPTSSVLQYPGVNVNSAGSTAFPLETAVITPWVYSYGYDDLESYPIGAITELNASTSSGDIKLQIGRFK